VDRITRKKLKADEFSLELGHTVTFFEEHREQVARYGGIAAAVAVLIAGFVVYRSHQHQARQLDLAKAIAVQEAPVGATSANGNLTFPTQEAKDAASTKAFGDLAKQFAGTAEGEIAQYYIASIEADKGHMVAAENGFKEVAQNGDKAYASLAKLSLSQIYFSDGRNSEAEKVLRDLMAHPTIFVSQEQATLALTQYLIHKDPNQARRLLEPLRVSPIDAVRNVAITQVGQLPQQ
jgi:predicted negative regulator of RcsB-dependent stress response